MWFFVWHEYKKPSVSALVRWKDRRGICMYATVYACIRRNTSKILPSCYCLKPVVKLTLSIWNDTIKLNILQGRSHKFYSDTRSEFYTLYRVCGSTDKDTKRVKWTLGVSFFVWQNVLTCIRSNHDKRRKEVFMPRKIRSNYMEKFKFVYNGRTFESKHKCCNFYGICYRSVMAYQNQYKCRTEEAITHFIELKKSKEIIFRNRKQRLRSAPTLRRHHARKRQYHKNTN